VTATGMVSYDEDPGLAYLVFLIVALVVVYLWAHAALRHKRPTRK
jgi:hypothetical protein